jgi:hypothetical protein
MRNYPDTNPPARLEIDIERHACALLVAPAFRARATIWKGLTAWRKAMPNVV